MDADERHRRVAEEAAEWWLILQGDASRPQREQYVDWLRESSAHIAEMLRVAQVHGALEQFQHWSAIPSSGPRTSDDNIVRLSKHLRNRDSHGRPSKTLVRRRVALAAAAALLIAAMAAVLQSRRNEGIIHTERGERREIALTDGSVVQVDPETRLRIAYGKRERRVLLETGRALFHVAKNSERPFYVQANGITVRAVGTAFAVDKSANELLLVTVSEGTVAVFPSESHAAAAASTLEPDGKTHSAKNAAPGAVAPAAGISSRRAQSPDQPVFAQPPVGSATQLFVTAGQQVSVDSNGPETVHSVDSARALAWAEGRLIFDNSSVADAVLQFNRYNRIQIIVKGQALARRLINGTFNAADPESFAAFMQSVARVRISRNDRADITVDPMN